LEQLLDKVGVDKHALYSYVGHLGYQYSRGKEAKDEYAEVLLKMISFKEMCENVAAGQSVRA